MKKSIILMICIGTFLCASAVIFTLYLFESDNDNSEKFFEGDFVETIANEEKISPNAVFVLKKYYDECGHCSSEEVELPCELVNLTEQEIEEYYTDWHIEEFEPDRLVLVKEINGYCDGHYLLKLEDGLINIYRLSTNGGLVVDKNTEISYKFLPEGDISVLEEGIMIYGKDNIVETLENYE